MGIRGSLSNDDDLNKNLLIAGLKVTVKQKSIHKGPRRSENTGIPRAPKADEAYDQQRRCEQTMLPRMLSFTKDQRKLQDIRPRAASEMVPLAILMFALSRLSHSGAAPDDTEGDPCGFLGRLERIPEKKAKKHHAPVRIPSGSSGFPPFRLMSE